MTSIPKLSHDQHTSRPWRIHEITGDFRLEDVWALPTPGGPDDFRRLLEMNQDLDLESDGAPLIARALFAVRWKLGELFGWDRPDDGIGSRVETVRDRLPEDLRDTPVDGLEAKDSPMTPLYVLDNEYAAEIANRTMHGIMHLSWVPDETGDGYHAQMAVLVKPNGLFGEAYMAFIRPIRYLLVYPALMRHITNTWRARQPEPATTVTQ